MEITDSVEFGRRLAAVAEVFDHKLTPAKVALYFEALRDLPLVSIGVALNQAVKVLKFFPKPVELRSLAVGDAEDAVEAAWMACRSAMTRVGGYSSLITSNAVLGETILAVFQSWPDACSLELTPEMWAAKRKEFGRVYRVFNGRDLDGARYLTGICEAQNSGKAEWKRFTPVAVLEVDAIRVLEPAEAEQYKAVIAAERSELTRITDERIERLLPSMKGAAS